MNPAQARVEEQIGEDDVNLTIKLNGEAHLIDTIVQHRKSKLGVPYFKLTMFCNCCKQRQYWCSLTKIEEAGSKALRDLAHQVQMFSKEDIEIMSE
mmetsp:Transcript_593/g.1137  ORF Transcript_593/g.1137 Transcript_593/m.1137 type:complete len:96 (+) Transcript_593:291-578(+)